MIVKMATQKKKISRSKLWLYYTILSSIYSNTQIDKLKTAFVENVERHSVVCSYEFSREINFGKVNVLFIYFFFKLKWLLELRFR